MRHSNHLVTHFTATPSASRRKFTVSPSPARIFFMRRCTQAIYSVLESLNSRDRSPGLYFNPAAQGKKEIHVY